MTKFRGSPVSRATAVDRIEDAPWATPADAVTFSSAADYTAAGAAPAAAPSPEIVYLSCGCASCYKSYTSFYADGVGDKLVGVRALEGATLIDTVVGDASTTSTIKVGEHLYSAINAPNDEDFFRVELVAGQTYKIAQLMHLGGNAAPGVPLEPLLTGVPLLDAYVKLFASDGVTLLAEADGGSNTTPSGLDAALFFTAPETGVYYINARSFDQDATNGTGGDHVGDYKLSVTAVPASMAPLPRFYANDELLSSIDWGSQFSRTSRNPDGNSGTRTDNGVPNGGTPLTESTYGVTGKNVITFYFAQQGDIFLSENPANPGLENQIQAKEMLDWEKQAFLDAFELYEQVADLQYIEVASREDADIKIILYQGTPGAGASLLGRMSPPGEQNAGQMEVNSGDVRWTKEGVSQGGFYFPTILHELGHGHGMKHPHDTGGGGPLMRGAEPSDDPVGGAIGGQYGVFGLSQGIYTMMSYNDGWSETGDVGGRPTGQGGPRTGGLTGLEVDHFGGMGTLAALDIAVLQDKYGVNEEWARGNDTYVIEDQNGPGVFYSTIWDGGGTDTISYTGTRAATIDLRPATLQYEEGGGGRVSFALGAWSGFTIANGVTIENATGGNGADTLIGNDAANTLNGRAGADTIKGGGGADRLMGGLGNDVLDGGDGIDWADYSSALGTVTVDLGTGRATGVLGNDTLALIENVRGGSGADTLIGDAGANRLEGGLKTDTLEGAGGLDVLQGGGGADRFVFSRLTGADRVLDFAAEDTIALRAASFGVTAATFVFQQGSAATGTSGVFLYDAADKTLSWDPDGAGSAAEEVIANFATTVTLTAGDFILI